LRSLSMLRSKREMVPHNLTQLMSEGHLSIEKLEFIEKNLAQLRQDNPKISHNYADGIYVRECFIPAGTFLIGAIHRTEHVAIMAFGHMVIWTADEGSVEINGYSINRTPIGTKRAGYAFQDSMFITCHSAKLYPDEDDEIMKLYTYADHKEFLLDTQDQSQLT